MKNIAATNDFVIKFANINGTGSSSANQLFAKAIFRMDIPVSPRNIFPSNIQGLPTWYEVRVSYKGYLGRRGGVDIAVCINPQSMVDDVREIEPGGYCIYDSTEPLNPEMVRADTTFIGIPFSQICKAEFKGMRQRVLLRNMIYIGSTAALLNIDFAILNDLAKEQFKDKQDLITANVRALELGYQYAIDNFDCPLDICVEQCGNIADHIFGVDHILMDGNTATALGALYGGATVATWYPITPATSVAEQFEKYAKRLRIDPGTGKHNYAVLQMEDELAALGAVIGASWNGARAFTATSGPGLSLMSELLGLAYFAEVPAVLVDVQRAGPSTGMPTRTQQSDVLAAAYASHGDTKHVLLFPATASECFEMTAQAFNLAERLQTPIIILSDLDLGMNAHMSPPLVWDDSSKYDRGKILNATDLESLTEKFGRYLDADGDGISPRTYPGAHPETGAFLTRGSSKDEFASYTESGDAYVRNMERLLLKFETAKHHVPTPKIKQARQQTPYGAIFFGSTASPSYEAVEMLWDDNIGMDTMRIRAFPFSQDLEQFIKEHEKVFVIEQNRDGQMRRLLINECELPSEKLVPVLHFDGIPITARFIANTIRQSIEP